MTDQLTRDLCTSFTVHFGDGGGLALARAPGRVNLIGEHIDYNGLPVFPMGIQRAMRVVFRGRDDDKVYVRNADSRYRPGVFRLQAPIPADSQGDWTNYVKSAAAS